MQQYGSAQDLYDQTYAESIRRARLKGTPEPDELTVFRTIVKWARNQVALNQIPSAFMEELSEVVPQQARDLVKAKDDELNYKLDKAEIWTPKDIKIKE